MKICMMTNTYLPHVGGVAHSVNTFAEDLRQARHKVIVVSPNYEGDDKVPEKIEKHVVRLPAILRFNDSDFSMRLPLTYLTNPVLQEFEPDIVHSHHPYIIGDSALRYGASKNAPVVFTHHTLHEEYTHNMPFDSDALKTFVAELCTQYANLCDAVIAPSESIAKLIKERGVTAPVTVIPTGIDVKAFGSGNRKKFRKEMGIPPKAFVVGHVGRLSKEKNIEYLGRAVCRFLKKSKDSYFLIIGDGPSAEGLKKIIQAQKLTERVIMPGKKTGRDLFDAYAAMDVFAFSSHSETQGMVLVEAMAAGMPVVALDASGARDVVENEKNGFLLESKAKEQEFAARLEELASGNRLRKKLALNARRTASAYTRKRSAAKLQGLYKTIIRQKRRQRSEAEESGFAALLKRIEVEWNLLTQKAEAVAKAFRGESIVQSTL
jgi:1,2-diacylglycerol 3-alpha-glucosyltransferase